MRAEVKQLAKGLVRLVLPMLLLSGCVYDPYYGGWVPCCSYGYGYGYGYGYPPPYYSPGPYGAPAQGPQQGYAPGPPQGYPQGYGPGPQQGYPPGPQQGYQPGPASAAPQNGGGLAQRFAAANVTHDGLLTREQAERGMPSVARNFDAIDIDHKGYVTLPEIRAFAAQRRAAGGGQPGQSGEEE
jgi:hypothetical protein